MPNIALTQQEFIRRAKETHGDRFDYSSTVYKTSKKDVEIICKIHGSFWQRPFNHIGGGICRDCSEIERGTNPVVTKDVFISRAKEVHGDRYDYSLVDYKTKKTNVFVICKVHGAFPIMPFNHINGQGCKHCKEAEKKIEHNKQKQIEFIARSSEIHNNKYDYSLVEYNGWRGEVKIICPEHGAFPQTAGGHLTGNGCPHCSKQNFRLMVTERPENYIKRAKEVHGDKNDYSETVYTRMQDKIKVTCLIHNRTFYQRAHAHLKSEGCPDCSNWGSGYDKKDWIKQAGNRVATFYIIRCFNETESFYKYGITINRLKDRYSSRTRLPYKYEIVRLVISSDKEYIWNLEKRFGKFKRKDRYHPLIKFMGDAKECFSHYHHNPTPAGAIIVVDAPKKPIYIQMQLDFAC